MTVLLSTRRRIFYYSDKNGVFIPRWNEINYEEVDRFCNMMNVDYSVLGYDEQGLYTEISRDLQRSDIAILKLITTEDVVVDPSEDWSCMLDKDQI